MFYGLVVPFPATPARSEYCRTLFQRITSVQEREAVSKLSSAALTAHNSSQINSPDSIKGDYEALAADFGVQLLVSDGSASAAQLSHSS